MVIKAKSLCMIMHSSKYFLCHIKLQKTMIIFISVLDIIHYLKPETKSDLRFFFTSLYRKKFLPLWLACSG